MAPKYADAGDRDLEKDPVLDGNGKPMTDEDFEQLSIAEDKPRQGRPSLSGGSTHSPQVATRVSESTKAKLDARAEADGTTVSDVVRAAIEAYV